MDQSKTSNNNNKAMNNEMMDQEGGGINKGGGGGGFMCRQSSSRWTPTSEQIRILKELYYNNGVRSPSADQIQRISARLRQYGKIEGKNVFYWFQNHKARERQKKRFTSTTTTTTDHHLLPLIPKQQFQTNKPTSGGGGDQDFVSTNKFQPNISPTQAPSSSVMVAVGHMGNYGYNGSHTFENSFRECSISPGGSSSLAGSRNHHMGSWIGVDPYSSPAGTNNMFEKTKYVDESMEDDDQEIETLPLFPIHGDRNLGGFCSMRPEYSNGYYTTTWYGRSDDDGGAAGSLELSLNSYATISPDDAM